VPSRPLKPTSLSDGPLRIPADEPFNIVYPRTSFDGGGRAKANAEATGQASCTAACTGRGAAKAEFRLGFKFDAAGANGTRVLVNVDVDGEHEFAQSLDATGAGAATSTLWVFITDAGGALLKSETLVSAAGNVARGAFHPRKTFEAELTGGTDHYVILAGRSEATSEEQGDIETSLRITAASIEIVAHPDTRVSVTTPAPQP
ncbi:MAG: hypothetical protein V3T70_05765, partial [Phycisphaerae bacterium]